MRQTRRFSKLHTLSKDLIMSVNETQSVFASEIN